MTQEDPNDGSWSQHLLDALLRAEAWLDGRRTERHVGDAVRVVSFEGYGTPQTIRLRGRVLHDAPPRSGGYSARLTHLINTFDRFESNEASDIELEIALCGATVRGVSDGEGYFDLRLVPEALSPGSWQHGKGRIVNAPPGSAEEFAVAALVPQHARLGIISDIDDTVLVSHVPSRVRALYHLLLEDARARMPFVGVADFYQALVRGTQAGDENPIFYVSSSPWNLYEVLVEFLAINRIPRGPLFLRDYGLERDMAAQMRHGAHKHAAIDALLATYPALPFVLIGDSGQKDPEIYLETVRRNPGRIAAIYIRDVGNAVRDAQVLALAETAAKSSVPMLLVSDTEAAFAHAESLGLARRAPKP